MFGLPCYLVPSSRGRLLVIPMTVSLQASRSLVSAHSSVSVQFVMALMSSSHRARGLPLFLAPPPIPNIIDFSGLQHPENELDVFSYYNSKVNNSGIKLIYTKYYSIRNVVINREFFFKVSMRGQNRFRGCHIHNSFSTHCKVLAH